MIREYKLTYAQKAQQNKDYEKNKIIGYQSEETIYKLLLERGHKAKWLNSERENREDFDIVINDDINIDVKYCSVINYGLIRIQILDETHLNLGWALRDSKCNYFCFTNLRTAIFISKKDLTFVYNNIKEYWPSKWEVRENCQVCYDIPIEALKYYLGNNLQILEVPKYEL